MKTTRKWHYHSETKDIIVSDNFQIVKSRNGNGYSLIEYDKKRFAEKRPWEEILKEVNNLKEE